MCCEEHHICTHCNQIITSTTDRCFAWRAGCADGDHDRNPGTEFGSGDRCFCPDGEEIVEEFYHDDDGFYCPNCSSAPPPTSSSGGRYRSDRPRPPPIDPVSGEEVVAVAAVDDSPTSCSDGAYSASSDEGGAAAAATPTTANATKGGGGWRLRVRKIVSGTTRLAGAGKRREDELREHELPSSADKRGTKTTVTSASVNGDGGAAEQNGPSSLL